MSKLGDLRVEISSPRLENTTFKGETRSLASAARIQQQKRAVRSQRRTDVSMNQETTAARGDQFAGALIEFLKPNISAPTLQTSTYKHKLMELPEAFSTLKYPKSKNTKAAPGHLTSRQKE